MRVSVPAWDKGGPGLGRAVEYDLLDSGFMAAKMNSSQNGYSLGIRWSVAFTLDHQHLSYGCCFMLLHWGTRTFVRSGSLQNCSATLCSSLA